MPQFCSLTGLVLSTSTARATSVEHMGTRELTVLLKTVAHLESESVIEPNEEPTEIESLEGLYALEHDGEETMASLTDALVRLLLERESGCQLVLLSLPFM